MEEYENYPETPRVRPILTDDEREKHCEMLAYNQAEQMLEAGKAPTQVVIHFLKLATEQTRLEEQKLEAEVRLSEAKIMSLESQQKQEEGIERVLKALRRYQGSAYSNDDLGEADYG